MDSLFKIHLMLIAGTVGLTICVIISFLLRIQPTPFLILFHPFKLGFND
jgi:hypothetical protein